MRNTREYYDRFAAGYDRRRSRGYHALLDEMESGLVRETITGKRLLDAGCGTGLITLRLEQDFDRIIGTDLSSGMLRQAFDRGQTAVQADLGSLPFKDGVFDGLFSFKVLAHIPDLPRTLRELKRVTRPGGRMVLEFYNPRSLRGLKKRLRIRHRVAPGADETQIFTAFHTPADVKKILPDGLEMLRIRGVMIFTPLAVFYRLPLISSLFRFLERRFCDSPLKRFGGFLAVTVTRRTDPEET